LKQVRNILLISNPIKRRETTMRFQNSHSI